MNSFKKEIYRCALLCIIQRSCPEMLQLEFDFINQNKTKYNQRSSQFKGVPVMNFLINHN